MNIQPVFSRSSISVIVAGAVLALGSAHAAMAQEQVVGHAMPEPMGGMAPTASVGSLGSPPLTVITGPSLGDLPSGPQMQAKTPSQGQAALTGQGSSPDGGASPTATTTTAAGDLPNADPGANPVDPPPPPPLIAPVVPPLEHKSGGLPIWLVVLMALAALLLGRQIARGSRR